jgi:hypothetical protein
MPTKWNKHVMSVYRRNKKAGLAAAMRKAKKTYRKKKKKCITR